MIVLPVKTPPFNHAIRREVEVGADITRPLFHPYLVYFIDTNTVGVTIGGASFCGELPLASYQKNVLPER